MLSEICVIISICCSFQNDLDLDLFCREIVKVDIERIKRTPCPNAPLGSQAVPDNGEPSERVEEMFGK